MLINLYHVNSSGPCRVVRLVAAALDVNLNLITVDLMDRDDMDPEFVQANPQQTLPTIVDDGFALWEYNAIARYFCNRYAPESDLYPSDPQKRALVDQRMDFELSTLYPRFASYFVPVLTTGVANSAVHGKVEEGLKVLECYLDSHKFVAGNQMTIADLSIVTTISNLEAIGFNLSRFINVRRWYSQLVQQAPQFNEINQTGAEQLRQVVMELKAKFKKTKKNPK